MQKIVLEETMPKNLNYPLASFQKAYTLADAADALGGSCTIENCAQKMQRKVSGGFMVIVSAAQKFSLVIFEKGIVSITKEYKLIKHAYTNTERMALLQKAFLAPQVFSVLYQRFKGRELPVEMLDKILIREFGVEESTSGRIAGYFTDGLKTYGLLNNANHVLDFQGEIAEPGSVELEKNEPVKVTEQDMPDSNIKISNASFTDKKSVLYELQVSGPGIDSKIDIDDEEDLLIVEVLLKKIRKVLKGGQKIE